MISLYYGRYVDLLAADRGAWAFIKWFVAGVLIQLVAMLPAVPLLALALRIQGDPGRYVGVCVFLIDFLVARVFLFAVPCARASERKGLGYRLAWGIGGLLFGQWILALVAALPPKTGAPAA